MHFTEGLQKKWFIYHSYWFDFADGSVGLALVLSFGSVSEIHFDIFFCGKHLVLGGDQYSLIQLFNAGPFMTV
jgi:hypothetical protein